MRTDYVPRKHSDMLADAWCSHNRQLAERFSQAMKKARAELGQGGNFTALLKSAWASDPGPARTVWRRRERGPEEDVV
jgi:hypothetical protein